MNYTNREVVRKLKQYDMFLNSLNLTTDEVQKERICDQLDKIEKQILLETNAEYEEEYNHLIEKKTRLIDEEKDRLHEVISLIMQRREYLEDRKEKHRMVTGSLVELTTFAGEDKLSYYKNKLKTIEKYEENKVTKEKLIKEMKSLDIKISEASRNVKANMRLNDMLETKMISTVTNALEKLDLFSLTDGQEEIFTKHSSLSYAKDMATENMDSAKELNDREMISECDKMLMEITKEFSVYDEKVNIINLINIYDNPVTDYNELLNKRERIDEILKNISGSELYKEINAELSKEYNTIKLEKQDIKTYDELKEERDRKNKQLYDIDEENNSKEFKELLEDLIINESKYREERINLARKQESLEREKKIKEEQKIEASRVRRQKLIEEARLKEQMANTERLKELQKKTVIVPEKEEKQKEDLEKKIEEFKIKSDSLPEMPLEEKIHNPLENKTLDEMLSFDDKFNTDELFENTKIVPNKVIKEEPKPSMEESLFKEVNNIVEEEKITPEPPQEELPIWEPIQMPEVPEVTQDLFKEAEEIEKVEFPETKEPVVEQSIPEQKEEIKEEVIEPKKDSIYDILENNQNIIWKTTETKQTMNPIPVIENKNKEIPNNSGFPELQSKEGEILWKETL